VGVEGDRGAYIYVYSFLNKGYDNNGREIDLYVMWGLIILSDPGGQMAPPDGKK
jgi:hypothetical protein